MIVFPYLVSIFVTFFTTILTIRIFKHFGWLEDPRQKQAKTGNATASSTVPRGGGLPIFLGITISFLFSSLYFHFPLSSRFLAIFLALLFNLIVGLVDDVIDISPKLRLFTNLVSALIIVAAGIGIAYVSNPFGPGILNLSHPQLSFQLFGQVRTLWLFSDLFAVFWLVWCTNIVGWATGIEGQLPGFASIAAFFIALLSLRFSTDSSQLPVFLLALSVSGAFLGFLPFNFYPQKIMPGYSGKSLAGFLLAVLSILSGAKVATLVLLLSLPMLDGLFVLLRRFFHHKPLYLSDGYHFHHRLLKLGWGRRRIAIFYWLVTFLAGLLALSLNSQQKFYAFLCISLVFLGFLWQLSRHNEPKSSQSNSL